MKKLGFLSTMLALVLVFGLAFVSCNVDVGGVDVGGVDVGGVDVGGVDVGGVDVGGVTNPFIGTWTSTSDSIVYTLVFTTNGNYTLQYQSPYFDTPTYNGTYTVSGNTVYLTGFGSGVISGNILIISTNDGVSMTFTRGGGNNPSGNNPGGNNPPLVPPGGTTSTFTLTDIPSQYYGKYALIQGLFSSDPSVMALWGFQNYDESTRIYTLVPVSNGSVSIPLKLLPSPFDDNETIHVFFGIYDQTTVKDNFINGKIVDIVFRSVAFTNGSATRSWNDRTEVLEYMIK